MLTQNYIKELATRKQTTELNIRREYLQHLFLSYFYQQPKTESVFFKGGTALRILYGSPRFSLDLDFSSSLSRINFLKELKELLPKTHWLVIKDLKRNLEQEIEKLL